jgi:hypothetical protein
LLSQSLLWRLHQHRQQLLLKPAQRVTLSRVSRLDRAMMSAVVITDAAMVVVVMIVVVTIVVVMIVVVMIVAVMNVVAMNVVNSVRVTAVTCVL